VMLLGFGKKKGESLQAQRERGRSQSLKAKKRPNQKEERDGRCTTAEGKEKKIRRPLWHRVVGDGRHFPIPADYGEEFNSLREKKKKRLRRTHEPLVSSGKKKRGKGKKDYELSL